MKKIILVVVLIAVAGIAGLVRSHTRSGRTIREVFHDQSAQGPEVRDEIHKSYELSPGARVEVSGINGSVKIETSDSKTAEVNIVRTGASQEALDRRKIVIENHSGGLTVRGERGDTGFLAQMFGKKPVEQVTLRLPRQVSLVTRGVNGPLIVAEIAGPIDVQGINGRVQIEAASGSAAFHGINGNISVGLNQLDKGGVDLSGINGNIELRLGEAVNADLQTHGMNGSVSSDMPNVVVDKSRHGSYSAQIGRGGSSISANGINGNIRLRQFGAAQPIGDQ
jgi:DUF4097 and DUF4098 domain-containing protein YvlB